MLVNTMYNKLALITGFPEYTNDTDTPEITRFLLQALSEGLHNVINNIYVSNNVLERTDQIVTIPGQDKYGIEGIIKQVQIIKPNGMVEVLPYADNLNQNSVITQQEIANNPNLSKRPSCYCIQNGYLRLFPIPDKAYRLNVTVSTTDLVWANDDSSRESIENINDSVMADRKFCNLVIIRAATLIFARAQNKNAEIYAQLFRDALADFLEHDLKTIQGTRFIERNAGHFRIDRGLLG